ncbi:hypothetical protein TREMEDRAFT_66415 [Tremella mesenterica DSM 1558]|uniref:uncharacterized protein n=1 Tax=Tremella mesenterica (strain ATCC 24925 / CBS 8224 / DSM 1558 / NBRC 9311 / NRRL Y-6157 / RJB 2259-6 / UBC 559-6) TaxID=578456 RepID=UPI00032BA39D|nr:uncharacterized protein TREMEDRAFT_66415 [Tremella mesenterica DSM 1558]EIW65585.1 hypothetical protein TREMEDRAFT_66415 [Tremella mesenterica DSM 1558]
MSTTFSDVIRRWNMAPLTLSPLNRQQLELAVRTIRDSEHDDDDDDGDDDTNPNVDLCHRLPSAIRPKLIETLVKFEFTRAQDRLSLHSVYCTTRSKAGMSWMIHQRFEGMEA